MNFYSFKKNANKLKIKQKSVKEKIELMNKCLIN